MPFALHPLSFSWLKHKNISWAIRRHLEAVRAESEVAQLCPTLCDPMDCTCQAPLSMGFSRQDYWSGLPFPSPGDLPNPGIEPGSPALQADSLPSEPQGEHATVIPSWSHFISPRLFTSDISLELEKLASLGYFGQVFFSFLMNTILTDMVSYFQLDTKCLTFHVLIWTCHILGTQYPHMASDYCIGHGSFRVEQSDLYDIEIHWFILKIFLTKILIV